jgi:hypothetical protein
MVLGVPASPSLGSAGSSHAADLYERQRRQHLRRRRTDLAKAVQHDFLDKLGTQSLDEAFSRMDRNGDGVLSSSEIRRGLRDLGIGLTAWQLGQILACVDSDNSGSIDREEFITMFTAGTHHWSDRDGGSSPRSPPVDALSSPYQSHSHSCSGRAHLLGRDDDDGVVIAQLVPRMPRVDDVALTSRLEAICAYCDEAGPIVGGDIGQLLLDSADADEQRGSPGHGEEHWQEEGAEAEAEMLLAQVQLLVRRVRAALHRRDLSVADACARWARGRGWRVGAEVERRPRRAHLSSPVSPAPPRPGVSSQLGDGGGDDDDAPIERRRRRRRGGQGSDGGHGGGRGVIRQLRRTATFAQSEQQRRRRRHDEAGASAATAAPPLPRQHTRVLVDFSVSGGAHEWLAQSELRLITPAPAAASAAAPTSRARAAGGVPGAAAAATAGAGAGRYPVRRHGLSWVRDERLSPERLRVGLQQLLPPGHWDEEAVQAWMLTFGTDGGGRVGVDELARHLKPTAAEEAAERAVRHPASHAVYALRTPPHAPNLWVGVGQRGGHEAHRIVGRGAEGPGLRQGVARGRGHRCGGASGGEGDGAAARSAARQPPRSAGADAVSSTAVTPACGSRLQRCLVAGGHCCGCEDPHSAVALRAVGCYGVVWVAMMR